MTEPTKPIEPTDATEHAVGSENPARTGDPARTPARTKDLPPAKPLEIPPTTKAARLFDAPAEPEVAATDADGDVKLEAELDEVVDAGVGAGDVDPETGGQEGPDPTRYGDWEKKGRCIDF